MKIDFPYKNFNFRNATKNIYIKGQSVVEYSMLIGVVIAVFIVLSPMVKRGSQSMVKLVSDEIGVQQKAEASGDASQGGLISSDTLTTVNQERKKQEWRAGATHSVQSVYDEKMIVNTTTKSDLGTR